MTKKRPPYEPNGFYHLFNHANGNENIFRSRENYLFFLKKYAKFSCDVVDTLAYTLMPNHFHLIVKVKSKEDLLAFYRNKKKERGVIDFHKIVHRQMANFLSGYVKAFNLYHSRKGSLLRQNTERVRIQNDAYLKNAIRYVHNNAVHHGFVVHPEEWEHTSLHAYQSTSKTRLAKKSVLKLFGGYKQFNLVHQIKTTSNLSKELEG